MNKIIENLKDKNVALLGMGKEGYSTYKYIRKYLEKQKLTILDRNDKIKELYLDLKKDNNIEIITGNKYLEDLEKFDIIIKTPGISLHNIDIKNIKNKIVSQLSLVLDYTDAYIIGITGTKGKSTTSSLIYKILKDQLDNVCLVGNIGNPILDYIDDYENAIFVTELSAHQLEYVTSSPKISIILNLYEEHLDHFKTLENYYQAKLNIFKYQKADDYALYCYDNETIRNYINNNEYKGKQIAISINKNTNEFIYLDGDYIYINNKAVYDLKDERKLIGSHNVVNIMFSLAVAEILNLDFNIASKSINEFNPLKHRLENIGTFKNITFYDDTIATIPEATLSAIKSLNNVNTLIFGGMDRGIDYSEFINSLAKTNVKNFICMPDTGYKIGKLIAKKIENDKNIYYAESINEVVDIAFKVTAKNSICLLSPAAPSYNKFKNFEEKGDCFVKEIKDYKN